MSIDHNHTNFVHPEWCDPRVCLCITGNVDHRSTPLAFKPAVDDYRVSVGLARMDGTGPFPHTGTDNVHLTLLDLASACRCGEDRDIGTDLSAHDARLLAAALSCAADQLDALAVTR